MVLVDNIKYVTKCIKKNVWHCMHYKTFKYLILKESCLKIEITSTKTTKNSTTAV